LNVLRDNQRNICAKLNSTPLADAFQEEEAFYFKIFDES